MRAMTCCLGLLAVAWGPAAGRGENYENFCASRVADYSPGVGTGLYHYPEMALDPPFGEGLYSASLDVVTLGVKGSLTLAFNGDGTDRVIADGPGADFIVFENPIEKVGVTPIQVFGELMRVQVSSDGRNYVEFPTWCGLKTALAPYGYFDPTMVSGFAGVHPVIANDFYADPSPYDVANAGGDAFDLSALRGLPAVTQGLVDINRIRYVRLVDVLGDGSEKDSQSPSNPIYDPTGTDQGYQPNSADVDAVAVVHGLVNPPASHGPLAGDADGDGLVGMLDYMALKASFGHGPGATWAQGDFNADGYVNAMDMAMLESNFGKSQVLPAGTSPVPEPCAAALLAAGWLALAGGRKKRPARPVTAG